MADISIVGAGRLGTSIGRALAAHGHHIRALACRSLASAKVSRRAVGQGRPVADIVEAAALGRVVILCLPDARSAAPPSGWRRPASTGEERRSFIRAASSLPGR